MRRHEAGVEWDKAKKTWDYNGKEIGLGWNGVRLRKDRNGIEMGIVSKLK